MKRLPSPHAESQPCKVPTCHTMQALWHADRDVASPLIFLNQRGKTSTTCTFSNLDTLTHPHPLCRGRLPLCRIPFPYPFQSQSHRFSVQLYWTHYCSYNQSLPMSTLPPIYEPQLWCPSMDKRWKVVVESTYREHTMLWLPLFVHSKNVLFQESTF